MWFNKKHKVKCSQVADKVYVRIDDLFFVEIDAITKQTKLHDAYGEIHEQ